MKNRGIKVLIVTVALVVFGAFVLADYMRRPQPSFAEAVQFIGSLHKYAESLEQRGQPPPALVELRELVEGGVISASDAHRFGGSIITISRRDAAIIYPQKTWIRVQLSDGRGIVMSVDGSVFQQAK